MPELLGLGGHGMLLVQERQAILCCRVVVETGFTGVANWGSHDAVMQLASAPTPHSLFPAAEKSAPGWGAGSGGGRREVVWVGPGLLGLRWPPLRRKTMVAAPQLLRGRWPSSQDRFASLPVSGWDFTAEL